MIPIQLQDPKYGFCRIKPNTKEPFDKEWQKRPLRYNESQVVDWIKAGNPYGVIGGYGELLILDIDDESIIEPILRKIPPTFLVRTGRGKVHAYFTSDNCTSTKVQKNKRERFSLRGVGNQSLCVGSIHPDTGKPYTIVDDKPIAFISRAELDALLIEYIPEENQNSIDVADLLRGVSEGGRNQACIQLATYYRREITRSEEETMRLLKTWNTRNKPPLQENELLRTIKSAYAIKEPYKYRFKKETSATSEVHELLTQPDLFDIILKEPSKFIVGEQRTLKTIFLVSHGGSLVINSKPTSSNLCVNARSGSGKDACCNAIAKLFEEEQDVFVRTKISPQVFTYYKQEEIKKGKFSWNGKKMFIQDCTAELLNCDTFKTRTSGAERSTIVIRNKAVDFLSGGKPSIVITTAESEPKNELLRRFSTCYLDESKDQTKEIMKRQAVLDEDGTEIVYDLSVKKALQKMKQCKVTVPFAKMIAEYFIKSNYFESVTFRTHFPRILDYVKFSAAIYQFQRQKGANGSLIAQPEDWDNIVPCVQAITQNRLGFGFTHKENKLIQICKGEGFLSASQIMRYNPPYSEKGLYKALEKLAQLEVFDLDTEVREKSKDVMLFKLKEGVLDMQIPSYQEIISSVGTTSTTGSDDTISTVSSDSSVGNDNNKQKMEKEQQTELIESPVLKEHPVPQKTTNSFMKIDRTLLDCCVCSSKEGCVWQLNGALYCARCYDDIQSGVKTS